MEIKKLASILVCLFVGMLWGTDGFGLFRSGDEKLNTLVSTLQKSCPMTIGDGVTMIAASSDSELLVIDVTASNPEMMDFLKNEENPKERVAMSLQSQTEMFDLLVDAKVGISYRYILESEDTLIVSLSKDEVKQIQNRPKQSPKELARQLLLADLETENKSYPTDFEDGIRIEKGAISDDEFTYYSTVDEDLIDMDAFIENKSEVKQSIFENLNLEELMTQNLINNLVLAEYKLAYKYTGNKSQKSLKIVFPLSELNDQLKKHKK